MTPPDRPRITPELVDRFRAYWHEHPTWGALHIVLDDGNYSTDCVEFCVQWAEQDGDVEGAELARILLSMSRSQRGRVERYATMHKMVTLDTFEIPGRGTAHLVDVPPFVNNHRDPRTLVGARVWLDGRRRTVAGVEAPAVPWTRGSFAFRRVALLLAAGRTP